MKQATATGFDICSQKARNVWASSAQWAIVDMVTGADREMFRRNPGLKEFTRPAFPLEAPSVTILPGTLCRVVKLSPTRRQRLFIELGASEEGQGVIDIDQTAMRPPKVRRRAGKPNRRF